MRNHIAEFLLICIGIWVWRGLKKPKEVPTASTKRFPPIEEDEFNIFDDPFEADLFN